MVVMVEQCKINKGEMTASCSFDKDPSSVSFDLGSEMTNEDLSNNFIWILLPV